MCACARARVGQDTQPPSPTAAALGVRASSGLVFPIRREYAWPTTRQGGASWPGLVWLYLERAPAEERLRAWDTVFLAETYPVNAQFYDLREDERVRSMDEIWETMEAVQAGTNRSAIKIIASMDEN